MRLPTPRHRLAFAATALAFALILGGYFFYRLREMSRHLDRLLVGQIETQLGRAAQSGPVHVSTTGRFTIQDLRIAEDKSFAHGTFLQVDRVEGRLNLPWLLLHPGQPLAALQEIDLLRPSAVIIRGANGRWNFQDLLKPKKQAGKPTAFTGIAHVRGGTLLVRDYRAKLPAHQLPAANRLLGLDADVNGHPSGELDFQAHATGDRRLGPLTLSGRYTPATQNGSVAVDARDADLAYWVDYVTPPSKQLAVTSGKASVSGRLNIAGGKIDLASLNAKADVAGAAVRLAPLRAPLSAIHVVAVAKGASVSATATGRLQNIPLTVIGRVADVRKPALDIHFTTGAFAVERLVGLVASIRPERWPDITGMVALSAHVTGSPRDPTVEARVTSPRLVHPRAVAQGVDARATLLHGLVRATLTVQRALGGPLSAQGTYRLLGPAHPWSAAGRFAGIDLAEVAPPSMPMMSGTASGSFTFGGAGRVFSGRADVAMAGGSAGPFRFRQAVASATTTGGRTWETHLSMASGSARGFDFRLLNAYATVDPTGAVVHDARADAWRGHLRAAGRVARTGAVDLRLNADGVRLSELLAPVHQPGISGIATFDGRLTGARSNLALTGHVAARNGSLRGLPYSLLDARINATPTRLALQDATLRSGGGLLALNGDVALRGGRLGAIDLSGRFRNVPGRIFRLASLVPGRRFSLPPALDSASLSGGVHIRGTAPDLSIALAGARVALPSGLIAANGTVSLRRGDGSARLTARLVDVPAAIARGLRVGGRAIVVPQPLRSALLSGTATVSGPLKNLRGAGDLAAGPFALHIMAGNPVLARQVTGHVVVQGKQILISRLAVASEAGPLTGGGEITLGGPIRLHLAGSGLDLARLDPVIGAFAQVSGAGDLAIDVTGPASALVVSVHAATGPIVANGVHFDGLTGDVAWNDGRLLFHDVVLRRSESAVSIPSGAYNLRSPYVAMDLRAFRLDLMPLLLVMENSPFLNSPSGAAMRRVLSEIPVPRQGIVDGALHLQGPPREIIASVDMTGEGVALGETVLNQVAVRGTLSAQSAHLADLRIDSPGLHLAGAGDLSRERPLDFTAHLSQTEVPAVVGLVEGIPALRRTAVGQKLLQAAGTFRSPITGTVDAAMTVSGPPGSPQGRLTFTTAGLTLGPQRFDVAEGSLALRGRRMYVENLRMEGGDAVITAGGSVGLAGDIDFELDVNNLNVQLLAPWLGLPRDVAGVVDSLTIRATGTQQHPVLQASLLATGVGNARFKIDRVEAYDIRTVNDAIQIGRVLVEERAPAPSGALLTTTISGQLPFTFSPLGVPNDRPIAIHAVFDSQNLGVLAAFTPEVKAADGTLSGGMDVTGTIARPVVSGAITLQNGSLQLARFRNRFTDLNTSLTFANNRLTVTDLRGASDRGGDFSVTGSASLASFPRGLVDLTLQARGLSLAGSNVSGTFGEQFTGRLDGSIAITGSVGKPVVAGGMTASGLSVSMPETAPSVAQAPPAFPVPNAVFNDVRFTTSNAEVRRGSFQGRISGGVTVNGTVQDPRVTGRLTIDSGRVRVATKTFTIQDGSTATIAYQPSQPGLVALGGARIRLDVEATTHITTVSEFDQTQQSYLITVTITGPLDNPTLDFRSDPPDLSRQEILASLGYQAQIEAILHGGSGGDRAFRQGLAEAFSGVLVPTLFEPVESAVMQALGLEDFTLTYGVNSPLQVQLTKRLFGNFYTTYQRQVTGVGQQYQLKLYYRLSPRINLSYTTDDRNVQTWAVEGRLRF